MRECETRATRGRARWARFGRARRVGLCVGHELGVVCGFHSRHVNLARAFVRVTLTDKDMSASFGIAVVGSSRAGHVVITRFRVVEEWIDVVVAGRRGRRGGHRGLEVTER